MVGAPTQRHLESTCRRQMHGPACMPLQLSRLPDDPRRRCAFWEWPVVVLLEFGATVCWRSLAHPGHPRATDPVPRTSYMTMRWVQDEGLPVVAATSPSLRSPARVPRPQRCPLQRRAAWRHSGRCWPSPPAGWCSALPASKVGLGQAQRGIRVGIEVVPADGRVAPLLAPWPSVHKRATPPLLLPTPGWPCTPHVGRWCSLLAVSLPTWA